MTTSMPQRGTQRLKEIVCCACGFSYLGHHLSKRCGECKAAPKIRTHVQDVCECGTSFPRYRNGSRQRYCSGTCLKRYDKRGDSLRKNPNLAIEIGRRPKPNHGLKGHKQSEEHLIKRLGGTAIRASKEELSLVPVLSRLGYKHTGEGSFWRRWKDGSLHNPDFVNEKDRSLVEYFGSYWHADDRGRENEIKESWTEIGWDCTIIWSEELDQILSGAIGFGMIGK